jgi:hypothetical protein
MSTTNSSLVDSADVKITSAARKPMRNRTLTGGGLLVLVLALLGCGDRKPLTTLVGPSPVPPQAVVPTNPASNGPSSSTLTAASLSGVVYEMTPTGQVPIPGAVVYCESCGEITHTWATADANGFYRFPGDLATGGGVWLSPGRPTSIIVRGVHFEQETWLGRYLDVFITGDTRFDVELVRR